MIRQALALAAATAFAGTAFANAVVGQPAPGFTLTDLAGKPVNLADYKGKTVVLEWHNFNCPFVQKHYKSGNMQALQKKYGGDVVWLAVNSTNNGHQDWMEPAKIGKTLSDFGAAPAKYLVDEPGKVGLSYGAKTTPHMYIIDETGRLVYMGGIDSVTTADPADIAQATQYVRIALQERAAGKPISAPVTRPYGCSVKY